jgi:FAD/FMN-containing dehydrogenase
MSPIAEAIALAAPTFSGQLLLPTDPAYDQRRKVHNGLIDKRPAAIASCRGVADIVDAVRLARTLGLEVSVRGGGHNVAGRATIDGGLMIDLSPMKGVHVDARARAVRAQGGVLWNELNRETQLHGLATTGGVVGTTGIAGLTLGGGLGWLMPKYGLALDNLRSAELVLADGSVLRVSADENPDLFWAIRGGGGNFGIAASLEYQLHKVGPMITGGVVVHPMPRALDALRFFRDQCNSLPDEAMLVAALQTAPDGSNAKIAAIVGAHCGSIEQGEAAFRPLKTFGPPVMDMIGPMPYATLSGMLDTAFPKGALNYWKAQFLTDLSDAAIQALIAGFEQCPSPMSHVIIEHFHGAATRVPLAATACTTRVTGFNVVIVSQWTDARESERSIRWARETFASLTPFLAATRYLNYLEDDAPNAAAVAYGPNLQRLRAIKTQYDPANFFRHNVNILPK